MQQYISVMRQILSQYQRKVATRAGSDHSMPTIGMANAHFSHDLKLGFPLVTTRQIVYRATFGELRSFLMGHDHVGEFQKNGCHFWDSWAKEDGYLGPVYGVQWNRHGQLSHVLESLRERPTDRRMVVSAWRPDEHADMVLPPCHFAWVVTPYSNQLNLSWIQRSCDWPVGVPHNIASYALLTHLLANWAGLDPGNLSALFCDAHIYVNQVDMAQEQVARATMPLPKLILRASRTDFHDWEAEVDDYHPHAPIRYEVTV